MDFSEWMYCENYTNIISKTGGKARNATTRESGISNGELSFSQARKCFYRAYYMYKLLSYEHIPT